MDIIRDATADDIHYIVEIIAAYKTELKNKLRDAGIVKIKQLLSRALAQENTLLIVYTDDGEKVSGFLNAHIIDFPLLMGREMYISDMVVSSDARGEKIGTRLIEYIEEYARELGCNRLMLNNAKKSEAYTRGFYPKKGFEERVNFANFIKKL